MRRTKAYRLIFVGVASVLLGGCSGSSKANMEEAAEQPAVVDYTCISNPESDKQIYVILKNYHGAYWEEGNRWYNRSCKKNWMKRFILAELITKLTFPARLT
ncbi:MAG: hypothetical protein ACLRW4_22530 [Ruminococcus sp.]